MSKIVEEVEAANRTYADDFGSKKDLKSKPTRRFAILTCMDARLDPAKFAGLVEGDAHVIRNAGGRASEDAVRSLLISYKLLDTKEWFVVHHTGCGMETVTDKEIDEIFDIKDSSNINWLTFKDNKKSLVEDVLTLRNHPLVPRSIPIYGYIYNCSNGILEEVKEATLAGQSD
jgi:carbonic anhydrase